MATAVELKRRGHQVGYATGRDLKYSIETEGFDYFQVGPPGMRSHISEIGRKVLKFRRSLSNYYFFKLLMEFNRETVNGLRTVVRNYQPDVLVVDSLTFAGGEIAELSQLPWATTSAVPGMIPSNDAPPFTNWGLPPSRNFYIKQFYNFIRFNQKIIFRLLDIEFNKLRSTLGLPLIKYGLITTSLSPYLILILSCEGFEYQRSDWPPQAHLVGPSPWGKNADPESSFEWIDELLDDIPIIYVTLGTFHSYRSLNFFKIVIEALKNEPYRVVMSVGYAVDMEQFKDAPPHFRIERFVPHAKILPHASAVVHHGGFSVSHDTISHGLPSVVTPIDQDLFENARRCVEAGVSLKITYARLNPQRLRKAVRKILQDEQITHNAKSLQRKFLSMNAGARGAGLLEKLAEGKKPVYHDTP